MIMSDKKPTSPLFAWFEAGLGLVADQVTQANQQVQQTLNESQQALNELASRGEQVESQLRNAVDPAKWCDQWNEVWRQSPLHHWMPSFTTPRQKRAAQIDVLSGKVDLLVEQVALLAAKQAAAKSQDAAAKPATKPHAKAATSKPAEPASKAAAKATTTRKTTARKPAATKAKTTPPKQD
jgi:hypothetical protein